MATVRYPRRGSLQYWPRKKASRPYSRVRHYVKSAEAKLLGFAGYKAGMTHAIIVDNRSTSLTKGQEISMPVTIIECPPMRVASLRFYKRTINGLKLASEVFVKTEAALKRAMNVPKNVDETKLSEAEKHIKTYEAIRVNVYTQPKNTGVGKKTPEIFELAIGGTPEQQLAYAKSLIGKEIKIQDVFKEGTQVDIHAVTKGKGFQGPVKRFGVDLRPAKSEKGQRGPANVGPWTGNRSWTVAHAGQMGFHNRMERNKWIVKISDDPKTIKVAGGHLYYGEVRTTYILIKGSVGGARKRMVRLVSATRKSKKIPEHAPQISYLSLKSKQGV
jgi:large subunit ribosomal protein L3